MEYYFIIVTITVLSETTLYQWRHLAHLALPRIQPTVRLSGGYILLAIYK